MPKVRNAEYTKEYNRKVVLRLLRSHPASRAELARLTGLTRAATSLIANELLADGVIRELAPEIVGRGRSVIPLAICPDKYYAISVCLERDVCEVGLCDFSGDPVVCRKVPAHGDPLAEVIAQIERLLAEHDRSRVLGIGISSPGPLDSERGAILNPPRFPQWHGVEVAPKLSKWFSLPAYLENNAMALAMHQHRLGTSEDFLLMLVDQGGIGGGIVTRGKPLYGSRHFNCELGHASIRYDGRLCECGNRGCLEAYASIPNLLRGTSFPDWSSLIVAYGTDPEAKNLLQQGAQGQKADPAGGHVSGHGDCQHGQSGQRGYHLPGRRHPLRLLHPGRLSGPGAGGPEPAAKKSVYPGAAGGFPQRRQGRGRGRHRIFQVPGGIKDHRRMPWFDTRRGVFWLWEKPKKCVFRGL